MLFQGWEWNSEENPIILIYTQYSIVKIAISIWKTILYDGQTTWTNQQTYVQLL